MNRDTQRSVIVPTDHGVPAGSLRHDGGRAAFKIPFAQENNDIGHGGRGAAGDASQSIFPRRAENMSVFFLVGPRGSGKSLAAKLLMSKYGCRSVDTDRVVLDNTGKSVAEIVAEEGWPAFREYEKKALRDAVALMAAHPSGGFGVVATGGGMILDAENRAFMREKGTVAYLTASPERLIDRLLHSRAMSGRPPLSNLSFENEVRFTMAAREPLYRETAHHLVNAELPAATVARVLYEIIIRKKG